MKLLGWLKMLMLSIVLASGCRSSKPSAPPAPQYPGRIPTTADWSAPTGTGLRPYPEPGAELTVGAATTYGQDVLLYCTTARARTVKPTQPHFKNMAVAQSRDGTAFSIARWNLVPGAQAYPNNNWNEGVAPARAIPAGDDVWLYYSHASGRAAIRVDIGLMRLTRGLDVAADSIVLRHDQSPAPPPWPHSTGDEIVGAFMHGSTWHCFYITDAKALYLAWGPSPAELRQFARITAMDDVYVMGGGDTIRLAAGDNAFFFVVCPKGQMKPRHRYIRVLLGRPETPAALVTHSEYPASLFGGSLMTAAVAWHAGKWRLYTNGPLGPHDEETGEIQVRTASE